MPLFQNHLSPSADAEKRCLDLTTADALDDFPLQAETNLTSLLERKRLKMDNYKSIEDSLERWCIQLHTSPHIQRLPENTVAEYFRALL